MSFQSVMFSAERNARELQKYLSLPLKPLTLRHLHGLHLSQHDEILGYTRELAVRTARSYAAFFDPVVQHCLEKVPRLPWAKEVSLREFQFCVQLQEVAEKYVWEKKRFMGLPTAPTHASLSASSSPSSAYSVLEDENLSTTRDCKKCKLESSFRCETYSSPMRDRIVSALQRGEITLSALPFETALALLRPEHSLLHVLVNETHIDYLPLNLWFSKFCQRRVAWRVLHEHLLHVLQPIVFPYVIEKGSDVLDLVYHAADVVMEIHAMRPIMDDKEALLINAKLDDSILETRPTAPLVCASNSSLVSGEPAATSLPLYPASDVIYAVDSHLKYVFRELLKNAYAAVVVSKPQVELEVKAALDDQWVTVDVADQGHGIDPRYDNDIWRFGFTTSADSENLLEGFGVGLPTSKVYMDLWGGHIEAYSSEQGTTMRVRFPKAPTEQMVPDSPQFWPEEIR